MRKPFRTRPTVRRNWLHLKFGKSLQLFNWNIFVFPHMHLNTQANFVKNSVQNNNFTLIDWHLLVIYLLPTGGKSSFHILRKPNRSVYLPYDDSLRLVFPFETYWLTDWDTENIKLRKQKTVQYTVPIQRRPKSKLTQECAPTMLIHIE
jgi:hypothetical protein